MCRERVLLFEESFLLFEEWFLLSEKSQTKRVEPLLLSEKPPAERSLFVLRLERTRETAWKKPAAPRRSRKARVKKERAPEERATARRFAVMAASLKEDATCTTCTSENMCPTRSSSTRWGMAQAARAARAARESFAVVPSSA